ncbi:lysophospholipid acyltransferase family protein [Desulfonatronospira sp.]|uniref:lysophospholipid acyltransferase family protein n=1 Tax=Desulfonatronospira sp. TaxID=1962951 RepID=UPI0025BB46A7|nr:lysophospholipid acyltransferase family protein [Desulfonatronospira sp.]
MNTMSVTENRDSYVSNPVGASWIFSRTPNVYFYPRMLCTVFRSWTKARWKGFTDHDWILRSVDILRHLERVGCRFIIRGKKNFIDLDEPCVFVGNHMSTLETFALGAVICPHRQVTFVVKEGLVRYPVFKHIMISRDPVVVKRVNPRDDFKVVMEEGLDRLQRGISVVVFPQAERSRDLDKKRFNSMGVKLARKAAVPVVPLALKTDAWEQGGIVKDFGKIRPNRPIRMDFGPAMQIQGNGKAEHQVIVDFIASRLDRWKEFEAWFG